MQTLEEIRPREKPRVMDLVSAAGIDVSDWARFGGGPERAATNPRYCYDWAFVSPGRLVVVNLRHESIRENEGTVRVELNLREQTQSAGKSVWRSRAEKLERAILEAVRDQLPLRVIVNDGTRRKSIDASERASRVSHRLLDPVSWTVTECESRTGRYVLTRGVSPDRYIDQFASASGETAEQRTATCTVFVRSAATRERVLLRAQGQCEHCHSPGFVTPDGRIFLETHHIVPLSLGGPDTTD